jgi:peptidoglycan LD-endopeptidase LytH
VKRPRFFTCLVLIGIGMIGILLIMPQPRLLFTLATLPAPTSLPVPVRGVPPKALADTWGAPRSGGRRHKGIDIFAKRGTEIIAPVSGVVLDIGRNRLGGNVVKILGPGPQVHYFAHLERFGPLRKRGLVRRGEVVGYVGDTGNARGTPPHLHYGIYVLPGRAINPYNLLTNRS